MKFFLAAVLRSAALCNATSKQARNQLGTPGGAKSFLRGTQIF